MFQKAFAARFEAPALDQTKSALSLWGFRRRPTVAAPVAGAPDEDRAFAAENTSSSFESFGRCGLQLGGLHRDQQWVGAWGGRC